MAHKSLRILPGLLLFIMAIAPHAMAQKASTELLSESPLDPCTSSLNCVHGAYVFDLLPSPLAATTLEVLKENKYLDSVTEGSGDNHRIDAVFNAWQYKDDVQIAIELHDGGSILFIRSESREGTYDLGVNKRRVKGIVKSIYQSIKS